MVRNGITSSYITRRPGANRLGSFCVVGFALPLKVYTDGQGLGPSVIDVSTVFNFKQCKGLLTRVINGRILKKEGDLKLNNTTC